MKPRGPLMIEHRLIEKMFTVVDRECEAIVETGKVDPIFIDTTVDFIRTYADRTHHGKEEDILFRDLAKMSLSEKDREAMEELVEEHRYARKTVGELVAAKDRYVGGEHQALDVILEKLRGLTAFYPEHIRKEDKSFFPDTERYFTQQQLDAMLEEFWEFDSKMIHEKYKKVVEDQGGR